MAEDSDNVSLTKRFIPKGVDDEEWKNMSLMDKWQMSYERDPMAIMSSKWPSRAGAVFAWYSVLTYFYVNVRYVIPEYLVDLSDTFRYYTTVLVTFITIQLLANWLCLYFYSSVHRHTRDNPPEHVLTPTDTFVSSEDQITNSNAEPCDDRQPSSERQHPAELIGGHRAFEDIHSNKTGLVWGYCDVCALPKPPRAHHCKVCEACVLKRDHHCYFANTCIGFYNQRYFVVWVFYVMVAYVSVVLLEGLYLKWKLADAPWSDLFLPVTLYKALFLGEFPVYYAFIVVHLYSVLPMGIMAAGFFTTQISAIAAGKTSHEIAKQVRIKSLRDSGHNFRSVFGGFWAFNLIFPAVIVFRQEGDGRYWDDVKKY